MALLVIDNYDSFTYNLVHLVQQFDLAYELRRNDEITLEEAAKYDAFIFSPGPGLPKDAGLMPALIKTYLGKKKILGVCLGMQALLEHLGAELINMQEVLHGRSTAIQINDHSGLFKGLPEKIEVGRYHSWAVNKIPQFFEQPCVISAHDDKGYFMAVECKSLMAYGVQFHPESIMTPEGYAIFKNWVEL